MTGDEMMKYALRTAGLGLITAATFIGFLAVHTAEAAEEGRFKNSFIIVGPALSPEYMGSDSYDVVPMLVSAFDIWDVDFEIEGLTARAGLLHWDNVTVGVTVDADMGRDSEVDDQAIARMKEIDPAVNGGAFVSYNRADQLLQGDNLELRLAGFTDTSNVHSGAYATLGMAYTLPLFIPWRVEFELETTYANQNYMNTYFGIDESDAGASGVAQFKAGNSFRDITFTTNIAFFFSPQLGLFSRLGVTRLLGDAADSPISSRGDATGYFCGLGVLYRF